MKLRWYWDAERVFVGATREAGRTTAPGVRWGVFVWGGDAAEGGWGLACGGLDLLGRDAQRRFRNGPLAPRCSCGTLPWLGITAMYIWSDLIHKIWSSLSGVHMREWRIRSIAKEVRKKGGRSKGFVRRILRPQGMVCSVVCSRMHKRIFTDHTHGDADCRKKRKMVYSKHRVPQQTVSSPNPSTKQVYKCHAPISHAQISGMSR